MKLQYKAQNDSYMVYVFSKQNLSLRSEEGLCTSLLTAVILRITSMLLDICLVEILSERHLDN